MNGRYHVATSPEDRIAIAVVAAIRCYEGEHPDGVSPGQVYLADFLKPFIERELVEARLDEMHRQGKERALRERELVLAFQGLTKSCSERVSKA